MPSGYLQLDHPEATDADYRALMADRPPKFTERQSLYQLTPRGRQRCAGCAHFYRSVTRDRRVCEVVRPNGDVNVSPSAWCKFWRP